MNKWTSQRIEIAVAKHMGYRLNLIIPNVSWGAGLNHECDLLMLRPSGYAEEFEIKISVSDLKKDAEKRHHHFSEKIKKLWFVMPDTLIDKATAYVPINAGIMSVAEGDYVSVVRPAPINGSRKFTPAERFKLMELGCMRIWTLKEALNKKGRQLV